MRPTRRCDDRAARSRLANGTNLALTLDVVTLKAAPLLGFVELLEAIGEHACARLVLAFGIEESSLPVPNRDELRQAWQARDLASRGDGRRMPIPLEDERRLLEGPARPIVLLEARRDGEPALAPSVATGNRRLGATALGGAPVL